MYEFHGWATIRENTSETDENTLNVIVDKIKQHINNLNWHSGLLEVRAVNGEYHLVVSGFTNHKRQEADDVFDLYKYVTNTAPGSYGLLYIRDDEDSNGRDNIFQVYVLVRGKLLEREDQYLSPVIPVIEDPY